MGQATYPKAPKMLELECHPGKEWGIIPLYDRTCEEKDLKLAQLGALAQPTVRMRNVGVELSCFTFFRW